MESVSFLLLMTDDDAEWLNLKSGQVIFYSKAKPDQTFIVDTILNGEQFASSFGYTIEAMDINGDKKLDIVVGAPFYYSKSEGGAVYIYLNLTKDPLNAPVYSSRLTGKPESRFGFALSNLGDLNKDGFNDLAIGAPYEDGGAVYVYLGSKEGLKSEPSQIIRASDLPVEARLFRTFGYSLSGGLDLDQNGYPDLLVGAYESDTVSLIFKKLDQV